MVDLQTVCCMCGDVGFPDKLFRCNKCRHRFQHSYCSNYYGELAEIDLCDWCQSEERSFRYMGSSNNKTKSVSNDAAAATSSRSEYSGEKQIKHQHQHQHHRVEIMGSEGNNKGKSPTPSPRPTTRRYKLLKDVMC